jgi:hypothetical protein
MEFVAFTHPRCFLFFLIIGYSSRILHLSLIVARTRLPPHPTRTRIAAGIHPSHACHCLSVLPDRGHFVIVTFVAAPLLSLTILFSPPSLSWAHCSTLCSLILPASNSLVVVQQTIVPTHLCLFWWLTVVFFMLFPITQLLEEWHCFLCPPSPLNQSHSPIMVSAKNVWSLP